MTNAKTRVKTRKREDSAYNLGVLAFSSGLLIGH